MSDKFYYIAFVALLLVFIPAFRRLAGIIIMCVGAPYFYHMLAHDQDPKVFQLGIFLLGVVILWW